MDTKNLSEAEYAEFKKQKARELGFTPKPKKRAINIGKMSSEQIAILKGLGAKTKWWGER